MPLNPRIFVEHNNYPFNSKTYDISLENIKVLFRWNAPVSRHLIESYRVSCSFSNQFGESQYCRSPILENCTLHYETNDVPANSTVHLKLDAHILFDNPVPELLVSRQEGILEVDYDMGLTHTLTPLLAKAPHMDFLHLDNYMVYGLDEHLTILSFDSMVIQVCTVV
ncbi:hypothetical protein M8J76_014016 [Diaphorina citri]|nr:hypothetical protein M8J76_014016 [Diaphorina citri]